ncbi:hypothetical protein FK484_0045 [Listeria phage LP-031]|uniref:Uncharacterized protein n=1 Tax=Listeria phage LP-031 TaxID=2590049 RepID=A0A514U754_9CAUD|nr:hypothetical protein FK484_0045 [Listeria phage LP-031]
MKEINKETQNQIDFIEGLVKDIKVLESSYKRLSKKKEKAEVLEAIQWAIDMKKSVIATINNNVNNAETAKNVTSD